MAHSKSSPMHRRHLSDEVLSVVRDGKRDQRMLSRCRTDAAFLMRALILYGIIGLIASGNKSHADVPFRVLEAMAAPELDARFQRTEGWIGADGNYSVEVTHDRRLWFHSDTWIGRISDSQRVDARLINNSVGVERISKTADGSCEKGLNNREEAPTIQFFWNDRKAVPQAIFQPEDGHGWFWPFGGIALEGRVHLFLWKMEKKDGDGAFGFQPVTVCHGEILNPLDVPTEWRVRQKAIPFCGVSQGTTVLLGSSVMAYQSDVMVYGVRERTYENRLQREMIVARVPQLTIRDFSSWRFRSKDGWSHDIADAVALVDSVATEFSVTSIPSSSTMKGGFLLVTNDQFLSPRIVARKSDTPWGPWSDAVTLFSCPEAREDKNVFCYAGKVQPGMSSGNEFVMSYASNAHSLAHVIHHPTLYWPRFFRVRLSDLPE